MIMAKNRVDRILKEEKTSQENILIMLAVAGVWDGD